MKHTCSLISALFLGIAAFAQAPADRVEFEVSSVKAAPPINASGPQVNIGVHIDGAQVHINSYSLKDYIRTAYKLKNYQIVGPDWIDSERFDIDAKLPAGGNKDQVPAMLQNLLADRFGMKVHNESKEFPVYSLEVAPTGLKLKDLSDPSQGTDDKAPTEVNANGGAGGVFVNLPGGASYSFAENKLVGKKLTMIYLADILSRFVDRPVVDATKLTGKYDMVLEVTEDDARGMMIHAAISAGVALPPEALRYLATTSDASLHGALKNAGLRMESRRAPLQVVVVDSMLKTPTEN